MKKRLAILVLAAACGRAGDNGGETASTDTVAVAAPAPEPAGQPEDTLAKGNVPASEPAARPPAGSAAQQRVRGTVRLTGTVMEPITAIETAQGTLVVRGELEPDVRALAGATVMLVGSITPGPRPAIDVQTYSVLEIEGQPATVGTVTSDARAITIGSDTVMLQPPPSGLEPGARIWVTGTRTGNTIRISSFGVIRPVR